MYLKYVGGFILQQSLHMQIYTRQRARLVFKSVLFLILRVLNNDILRAEPWPYDYYICSDRNRNTSNKI